ncbi:hypothetical protein ACGC1H_001812 [Rhizoctonia solani]
MLLGLISSFVFRAIRDSLPHNMIAQENIIKATLIALAIADCTGDICCLAFKRGLCSWHLECDNAWEHHLYLVLVSNEGRLDVENWARERRRTPESRLD